MKSLWLLLLKTKLREKRDEDILTNSGLTMIELLVGVIMAFLILTPLLTFVVDVLNTEKREQIKTATEQELQTGLDYIAKDLQQAIYIYDADAINTGTRPAPDPANPIKAQLPPTAAISGEANCTTTGNCTPILVFWKREVVKNAVPFQRAPNSQTQPALTCQNNPPAGQCDDTYILSLVAYYLIKDNTSTWCQPSGGTCPARITRFEISDGIGNPFFDATQPDTGTTGANPRYVKRPDDGYQSFVLPIDFKAWKKDPNTPYTQNQKTTVLLNYLDPSTQNVPAQTTQSCKQALGVDQTYMTNNSLTDANFAPLTDNQSHSFVVCVDSNRNTARIFLRGNALRRLQANAPYNPNNPAYFPTVSIQVQGRSGFGKASQ